MSVVIHVTPAQLAALLNEAGAETIWLSLRGRRIKDRVGMKRARVARAFRVQGGVR